MIYSPEADAHVRFIMACGFECRKQIPTYINLKDVAEYAGVESLLNHPRKIVLAYDQDFRLRQFVADLPGGLDTVHEWHAQVEKGNVGMSFLSSFNGFLAVGRFGDNFTVRHVP